jgi:glycerol-3-phosphate acyltransferase PlsY
MELTFALLVFSAYLIGSIPTSVWVGKIFYKVDVREHGSGNAGATNTIRVLGWKAGLPVFFFDVFKGWLAVSLADFFLSYMILPENLVYFKISLAAAVVLGHVFPLFAGFRGGKGVATLLGVGIALYPVTVWVVLAVFLTVLLITGYVSLGSVTAAVLFPFIDYFLFHQDSAWLSMLSILVAIFLPLTHRKNIRRLVKGEETRFIRWGSKRKTKEMM